MPVRFGPSPLMMVFTAPHRCPPCSTTWFIRSSLDSSWFSGTGVPGQRGQVVGQRSGAGLLVDGRRLPVDLGADDGRASAARRSGAANARDDVLVSRHSAIRLSVVPLKSSADRKYAVPRLRTDQSHAVGDVAGCSEYAGPSARAIGAPWKACMVNRAALQALLVQRVDLGTVEGAPEEAELVGRDVEAVPVCADQRLVTQARAVRVVGQVGAHRTRAADTDAGGVRRAVVRGVDGVEPPVTRADAGRAGLADREVGGGAPGEAAGGSWSISSSGWT